MSELLSAEGAVTENIVGLFKHGELKPRIGYYYIDMELGTFTLEAYITGTLNGDIGGINWGCLSDCRSVVVQRDCSPIARLQNWCTIGIHIASGLKYIHSCRYVHRDLKPGNGSRPKQPLELIISFIFLP